MRIPKHKVQEELCAAKEPKLIGRREAAWRILESKLGNFWGKADIGYLDNMEIRQSWKVLLG